jgi:hypothetical protein
MNIIMDTKLTLADAAMAFMVNIDLFTKSWQEGMEKLGWPKLLTIEEWQEQFDAWLSMQGNNDEL